MKPRSNTPVYGLFFGAAFALNLILGGLTYLSTQNLITTEHWVTHTFEVRNALDGLLRAVLDTDSEGVAPILPGVRHVAELTADNPDQQKRIPELTALAQQRIAIHEAASARLQSRGKDAAVQAELTNEGRDVAANIRALLEQMTGTEVDLLKVRSSAASLDGNHTVALVISGSGFSAVLAFLALGGMRRDELRRKRAEQRVLDRVDDLTRAQEALELRNLDLQQFAYVASHDLKTPLRSISGFVELLQANYGGQLDAQGAEWIRRASDGAHRLEALIDSLLSYARLDAQAEPFVPVAGRAVVDDALEALQTVIHESDAEVTAGELPVILGNRTQLVQLFQNLLGNGIKYRGAACPRLHVTATPKGIEWVFSVADNGIGIDPKHHERIFELFRRLHTQKAYAGDGIGLTLCRRIVTRHGGKIWLESRPGQGCTFFFTLLAPESSAL